MLKRHVLHMFQLGPYNYFWPLLSNSNLTYLRLHVLCLSILSLLVIEVESILECLSIVEIFSMMCDDIRFCYQKTRIKINN